eukprot:Lithocolla_globosa_v1_NODE_1493_length_2537_cov_12.713135.p2 type:complete len:130 gc:universal NODE_1493_length_2537_cov_12.713135:1771-2160(+)
MTEHCFFDPKAQNIPRQHIQNKHKKHQRFHQRFHQNPLKVRKRKKRHKRNERNNHPAVLKTLLFELVHLLALYQISFFAFCLSLLFLQYPSKIKELCLNIFFLQPFLNYVLYPIIIMLDITLSRCVALL